MFKQLLKAELAILSACQTARGRMAAGEGMIGMSWALFVAGCPAVVVSHRRELWFSDRPAGQDFV
jgi:CHAT domain-containing protein